MEDLNKEFVPYDLALRLKKIGFNLPCFFAFDNCSTPMRCSDLRTNQQKFSGVNYNSSSYTSQPTFSQCFRWFRDKYDLDHNILRMPTSILKIQEKNGTNHIKKYSWGVYDETANPTTIAGYLDDYEEAEFVCLEKLLEIVEQIEKL